MKSDILLELLDKNPEGISAPDAFKAVSTDPTGAKSINEIYQAISILQKRGKKEGFTIVKSPTGAYVKKPRDATAVSTSKKSKKEYRKGTKQEQCLDLIIKAGEEGIPTKELTKAIGSTYYGLHSCIRALKRRGEDILLRNQRAIYKGTAIPQKQSTPKSVPKIAKTLQLPKKGELFSVDAEKFKEALKILPDNMKPEIWDIVKGMIRYNKAVKLLSEVVELLNNSF
jgi:hypothetical protein